jgi:purine-binding chemotaxis protein CheW
MSSDGRFLVVRAGQERYGIGLDAVREVVDLAGARPVPARSPALRGVMPLRDRFCSLLHLGALLAGGSPPDATGETAVIVEVAGTPMALEVDDVEEVVDRGARLVGAPTGPWASGVWRVGDDLVTVLDLGALAERINEREGHDGTG